MIGPPVTFPPNGPLSRKVRCSVCWASGYPGCTWTRKHLAGHRRCPDCGTWLTTRLDGTARVHTRCPADRIVVSVAPTVRTRTD